jgi:hypothetical protein
MQRHRSEPHSFEARLASEKVQAEQQAAALSEGPEKDAVLKRINQLDTALRVNAWASFSGPQLSK